MKHQRSSLKISSLKLDPLSALGQYVYYGLLIITQMRNHDPCTTFDVTSFNTHQMTLWLSFYSSTI